MKDQEISRLESYLRNLFSLSGIRLVKRPKQNDSVEVILDGEFIGLLFRDDDSDGDDVSYSFQMSILECDLEK